MLEPGKKIGSYVLVRKLGAGGFGEVWQAEKHTKLSVNNFALKFFRPKEEDKLTLEKEKREIGIWQKVSGMPNIIGIIEADEFEEYVYVVSEYADGGSLESQMIASSGKAFSVEEAVTTILETLSGLNSLHQMSFVHRDVKPANILIRRGVHCLADFGISREMKAHSKSTQTAGTYEYMSPESFENRPVTIHSDIWAVGVIFQQLLTGSPPFPQKEIPSLIYSILNRDPEEMPQSIPAGLRDVVKKALEKNPQNRFNSAAEMIHALKYQQMMLGKSEWGEQNSQQTLVWEGQAQTERYTGDQISAPVVVPTRSTGDARPAPNTENVQQSHSFVMANAVQEKPEKSKRPLILAALGGSALLVLIIAVVGAAYVYKNTNLFTKNTTNSDQISNSNSNANANAGQRAESGMEIKPSPKVENTPAPTIAPEVNLTPTTVAKPTPEATRRRENTAPATPKPTPIKPQATPKKGSSDCIFTGDC